MQLASNTELQQPTRAQITRLPLILTLVLLLLNCSVTAQAEDSPATSAPQETAPAAISTKGQKSSQSPAANCKSFVTHLPARLVVFTAGVAIGTPIALVRCTHRELVGRTKEAYSLGGVPKPLGYVSAGFFGIPSGIICGACGGAFDGVADSWVNSKDGSLSKGTISLEKLEF